MLSPLSIVDSIAVLGYLKNGRGLTSDDQIIADGRFTIHIIGLEGGAPEGRKDLFFRILINLHAIPLSSLPNLPKVGLKPPLRTPYLSQRDWYQRQRFQPSSTDNS